MRPDVIVIGLGAMGLSAAWHLARRGHRVLGLEQFALGHDRGSSHGHTRIIRTAYYEHPDYVPLVRRAFGGWLDLEQASGRRLLTACPCLSLGPPTGELIGGVRRAAAEHALPIEDLSADDVMRRYPAFRFDAETVGVLEHNAGVLAVEDSLTAMAAEARRLGADLRDNVAVREWNDDGTVVTARGTFNAAHVVITTGPWATHLLGEIGASLRVMRQPVFWFAGARRERFRRDVFPIFMADTPGGYFYGLPALDPRGVKVAQHYGAPELPSPDGVDRSASTDDVAPVRAFLRAHLPDADGELGGSSVCLYTLTPDRHFLIDRVSERVTVAAGFSGHGFKFAPAVGEVLADLAESGVTALPAAPFRRRAFG